MPSLKDHLNQKNVLLRLKTCVSNNNVLQSKHHSESPNKLCLDRSKALGMRTRLSNYQCMNTLQPIESRKLKQFQNQSQKVDPTSKSGSNQVSSPLANFKRKLTQKETTEDNFFCKENDPHSWKYYYRMQKFKETQREQEGLIAPNTKFFAGRVNHSQEN